MSIDTPAPDPNTGEDTTETHTAGRHEASLAYLFAPLNGNLIVQAPLLVYLALAPLGLVMFATRFMQMPGHYAGAIERGGGLFIVYGATWLSAGAFRMVGAYIAHLATDGPAEYHLHVVPYLNLALGATFFIVGLMLAFARPRRPRATPLAIRVRRSAAILFAVTCFGLFFSPLIPFGSTTQNTAFSESSGPTQVSYYEIEVVATFGATGFFDDSDDHKAGLVWPWYALQAYDLALWGLFHVAMVSLGAAIAWSAGFAAGWRPLSHVLILGTVPALAALVGATLLYVSLAVFKTDTLGQRVDPYDAGWNVIPGITAALVVAALLYYVVAAFVPYVRALRPHA